MGVNRGKAFENVLHTQFNELPTIVTIRLYDVTTGYKNQNNICDFVVYDNGTLNLFELKAIHGNTLNFKSHIRENQWDGLLAETFKPGVNAGIICWFIDCDKTYFIDIFYLQELKQKGEKSFNINKHTNSIFVQELVGTKKRIYFKYNLKKFLEEISYENKSK